MNQLVLRLKDIATTPSHTGMLPVSPATIWRWVNEGKFPKPFKLGPRVTAWHKADIEKFIVNQAVSTTQ